MSDEQKFLITVRFPEWTQDDFEDQHVVHKYPPFGVKYLFVTDVIPYPEWPEDDERWLTYGVETVVGDRFISWYKKHIKSVFDGDILFIEPFDVSVASDKS